MDKLPPGPPDRIHIRAVAQKAGVSVATVSRVMNGVATVSPALRKQVWDAVSRMKYVPNQQARALGSGRSKLLGLIISDMLNPFFPELVQGFEETAVQQGFETLIASTAHDVKRMERCIERMIERQVEGVAIMTFGIEKPLLDRLSTQRIPMVFIDQAAESHSMSVIRIDYESGFDEAVQHLAVLGHRRFGFVAGPSHLHSATSRETALHRALERVGLTLPPESNVRGDHTLHGGMEAARQLLVRSKMPTALLCSNDLTAIGLLRAAHRAKVRVPEDLSVVGFDDVSVAGLVEPPLTTIRMSGHDIAVRAVQALESAIAQGTDQNAVLPLKTMLVVRQTTSVPLHAAAAFKRMRSKYRQGRANLLEQAVADLPA